MISVLTPTFNRYHTLQRLYDSLCSQNCTNFEWIIIDDGSVDDTEKLVSEFITERKIIIKYIFQENKGKPMAINAGVPLCQFDYILIVDSDDALSSDAIKLLEQAIQEAENEKIPFSGVGFRKATFDGNLLGLVTKLKNPIVYLGATEAGNLFKADLAYCFKKESLLRFPFPFYKGERFVPELFIWNKITDEAKIRFYSDKIIYLAEFLDDGLTKNFKRQLQKYPYSFRVYYADQFRREKKIIKKLKMLIRFFQCIVYEKLK